MDDMDDSVIVELYWQRSEQALRETQTKYEKYLYTTAYNILGSHEDSSECVNDTYMKAWQSIPPNKPEKLGAYLAAIVRNAAVSVFRRQNTASRAASQYTLSLDELAECVSGGESPEQSFDSKQLGAAISAYLSTLSAQAREIFVCRYYFGDSLGDIAGYTGSSEAKIKSTLFRARKGLKEYLTKEGFDI